MSSLTVCVCVCVYTYIDDRQLAVLIFINLKGTHYSLLSQLHDVDACTFLVELQLKRPYLTRGSDLSTWEVSHY